MRYGQNVSNNGGFAQGTCWRWAKSGTKAFFYCIEAKQLGRFRSTPPVHHRLNFNVNAPIRWQFNALPDWFFVASRFHILLLCHRALYQSLLSQLPILAKLWVIGNRNTYTAAPTSKSWVLLGLSKCTQRMLTASQVSSPQSLQKETHGVWKQWVTTVFCSRMNGHLKRATPMKDKAQSSPTLGVGQGQPPRHHRFNCHTIHRVRSDAHGSCFEHQWPCGTAAWRDWRATINVTWSRTWTRSLEGGYYITILQLTLLCTWI